MFDVYTMSCKDETYVGMTSNLTNRKYIHKARFLKKTTHGSDIIKSFASKEEAVLFEEKMIRKIATLNTQKR